MALSSGPGTRWPVAPRPHPHGGRSAWSPAAGHKPSPTFCRVERQPDASSRTCPSFSVGRTPGPARCRPSCGRRALRIRRAPAQGRRARVRARVPAPPPHGLTDEGCDQAAIVASLQHGVSKHFITGSFSLRVVGATGSPRPAPPPQRLASRPALLFRPFRRFIGCFKCTYIKMHSKIGYILAATWHPTL